MKVVLGAAMWNSPHMLVLDEPTNYLDRESLGALAAAIKEYGGGVVMISHHSGARPVFSLCAPDQAHPISLVMLACLLSRLLFLLAFYLGYKRHCILAHMASGKACQQ